MKKRSISIFLIRLLDFLFSLAGILIGLPLILTIFLVCFADSGSPLFLQIRVGRKLEKFTLIKFRTMKIGTPSAGTHLVNSNSVTKIGRFLRKTKLDELPQLLNIIKGDMSIVGPRPCLPNQTELIEERKKRNVFSVRPGITGLAQVKHIDMSTPRKLAGYDQLMIKRMCLKLYIKLIITTALGEGFGDRIRTH